MKYSDKIFFAFFDIFKTIIVASPFFGTPPYVMLISKDENSVSIKEAYHG